MNANSSLVIDIALLLGLLIFISRTVYLRSKREVLLKKYKSTSPRRHEVEGMLRTRRLVIAVLITAFVTLKTIFDVRSILQISGESASGQLLFIFAFSIGVCSIAFLLIYYLFNKSDLIIKP